MSSEPSRPGRRPRMRGGVATRPRLTAAAAKLMRRRGYYATGLNEVIAVSKAPKGSLYHYFPGGKEQLAAEAVDSSTPIVTDLINAAFDSGDGVAGALDTFARLLGGNLERSDFRDGCPVATVTLDAASESDAIRHSCAASFAGWRDAIADRLRQCGHEPDDAAELAVLMLSAFEGALLMARALRDVGPLFTVAASLNRLIVRGDHRPPNGGRS